MREGDFTLSADGGGSKLAAVMFDDAFHFQIEQKGAQFVYGQVRGYGQHIDLKFVMLAQTVHDALFFLA